MTDEENQPGRLVRLTLTLTINEGTTVKTKDSNILLTAYAGKLMNEGSDYMRRFITMKGELKIPRQKLRLKLLEFYAEKLDKLDLYLQKRKESKMSPELRKAVLKRIAELSNDV